MCHQKLCGQHWRYPTIPAMNPYRQHVVGEAVVAYSQQKSTHELLDDNPHLDEHVPCNKESNPRVNSAIIGNTEKKSIAQQSDSIGKDYHPFKQMFFRRESITKKRKWKRKHWNLFVSIFLFFLSQLIDEMGQRLIACLGLEMPVFWPVFERTSKYSTCTSTSPSAIDSTRRHRYDFLYIFVRVKGSLY